LLLGGARGAAIARPARLPQRPLGRQIALALAALEPGRRFAPERSRRAGAEAGTGAAGAAGHR
ncbi:hypothetical protein, partial [Streptomyces sp. NPDC004285]